jgi:hypothetical protein
VAGGTDPLGFGSQLGGPSAGSPGSDAFNPEADTPDHASHGAEPAALVDG